jgi:hypothetical protein
MEVFKAVITTLLIAAFVAFVAFLLHEVAVSQADWERYVYLLSGVEAIVFAAVGWLFGKEVHRERAEKAEATAAKAADGQLEATTEAAAQKQKGLSLAQAILAQTDAAPNLIQAIAPETGEAPKAVMAPLADLARKSYSEAR